MQTLSSKNASILSGLSSEVSGRLQPQVFRQETQPTVFKVGDIWIQTDAQGNTLATYVANSDSRSCMPGYGFSKTYGGGAASLTGELIDIDTIEGTINLGISNILNATKKASINLVSSGFTGHDFSSPLGVSQIHLDPGEIKLQGAHIDLMAGSLDPNATEVSAITLDGDDGIYIGSSKGITLYTGSATAQNPYPSANIELKPDHMLFGVSSTGSATFVEMTSGKLYMGAASDKSSLDSGTPSTSLAGLQVSPDGIVMAAGSGSTKSLVSILPSAITLGTVGNNNSGSFVQLAQSGIVIGSSSKIEINTTNFKIKSDATTTTPMLYVANNGTWLSATQGLQYTESNGLEVKGTIHANALYIQDSNSEVDATTWINGKVTPSAIWAGVRAATDSSDSTNYQSTALSITAKGLIVQGQNFAAADTLFELKHGDTSYMKMMGDGTTTIGGWTITPTKLYSGATTNYVGLDSGSTVNNTILPYAMWAGKVDPDDTFTGDTITLDGTTYNVINPDARGAPFRVTRNGRVYLDKLMIWDSDHNIYKEIDFSDFNQAVSLTSRWSSGDDGAGDTLTVTANYWGKFTKSVSANISFVITSAVLDGESSHGYGNGTANYSLNGTQSSQSVYIDAVGAYREGLSDGYDEGWNACREQMLASARSVTYYTGPDQIYNQQFDSWVINTNKTTVTIYQVPGIRGGEEG